jgi:hypothetical protein
LRKGHVVPNRGFLEEYPLYRRFRMDVPEAVTYQVLINNPGGAAQALEKPAVHMYCPICASNQTFNMVNTYNRGDAFPESVPWDYPQPRIAVARLVYRCTSCNHFLRHFLVKFDPDDQYVMKVGQEPPWDISLDPALERILGKRAGYYKRALISESQSYGIGAFAYHRRIVEEIIDDLLDDIPALMAGEEREEYVKALEEAKKTTVTQNKIDLVKDKLPAILRPGGRNPLSRLHETLSEGLHRESDERCMELAEAVRETLVYLVNQIEMTKSASARYIESMDRLQDRHEETGP